jgi:tetratricopeptide (TPR) repeat protein
MSRSATPTRVFGYSLATLCATVVMAALAVAQPNNPENRNRDSTARTSVGAPYATLCAEAAAAGRTDDEAAAACDRAVQSERLNRTNMIATQINRGALYLRRRDGRNALDAYQAVLGLDDDHAQALLSSGIAYDMVGQPGPAVASITRALTLGIERPYTAYYYRARAREALGDVRGAYEDYRTAIEIEPNWEPAFEELARFARVRRDQLAELVAEGDGEVASEPPASPGGQR